MNTPLHNVLSRLEGVTATGNGQYRARCPAHDDRHPSLSVSKGRDGCVLLKCHAGCSVAEICGAIHIRAAELFPVPDNRVRLGNAIAVYRYRDGAGNLLYEVLRYADKQFRQRRPDARDGWLWSLDGVQRVLYRLPELLASDTSTTVFITEGEKDADCLAHAGLVATCNPGGAGKWHVEYSGHLRGRGVVVIADKDATGRQHAREVCAALLSVAVDVKYLELPGDTVKDAADWFAQGGTAEALIEMARQAPAFGSDLLAAPTDGPAEAPWPDPRPLPSGLPPVRGLDLRLLPDSLRAWVTDVSERMQCPPDYVAVTAMISAATLIGRKVAIRPKRLDDWQVVPNLWGLCVGRPSLMKSPAMKEALFFLTRLEIEAKRDHAEAVGRHQANELIAKVTKKVKTQQLKQAVSSGGDARTVAAEIANVEASEGAEPVRRRYLVNNTTVEKLGVILNENPNGVVIYCDEVIGFLKSLDREGHEGDRAFYLTAWDGDKRYTYDRIGRGTLDIDAAIISFVGAIQPGVLQDYLAQAVRGGGGDDGLVQRFQLAVWPDAPRDWRNVDRRPNRDAKAMAYAAFEYLCNLTAADLGATLDERDPAAVPFVRFDERAQELFDSWRHSLEARLRSDTEHPAMEAHLAKYRSLVPSLALVLHLADRGEGPVSASAVERAIGWAEYLESHARRLYASVTEAPAVAARELARRVRKGEVTNRFAARDVYRKGWTGLDRERTQMAIDVLVSLNWLEERVEETPGRHKVCYAINPKLRVAVLGEPTEPTEAPSVSSVSPPVEKTGENETGGNSECEEGVL